MTSTATKPQNVDATAPKHRACDECRTRKLACTKEADGCSRCKREGLLCVYSAQKQMGRPRKRATNDEAASTAKPAASDPVIMPLTDTAMDIDTDNIYQTTGFSGMNLLSMNGYDFNTPPAQQTIRAEPNPPVSSPEGSCRGRCHGGMWSMDFGDVNIDPHAPFDVSRQHETMQQDLTLSNTPSLTESSHETPPSTTATDDLRPGPACSCLAGLYLALDSISRAGPRAAPAMRIARTASKAAYQAITCQICLPPTTADNNRVPASSFQNMMILGALLPTIADAYRNILDMVDTETARAQTEGRKMTFQLEDYGGMWGPMADNDGKCTQYYAKLEMEPLQWRQAVRAILKLDVYGNDLDMDCCPQWMPKDVTQLGLRDVVEAMDRRSRENHAKIDELRKQGIKTTHQLGSLHKHRDGSEKEEEPHCRRVIRTAKEAIEGLVIA